MDAIANGATEILGFEPIGELVAGLLAEIRATMDTARQRRERQAPETCDAPEKFTNAVARPQERETGHECPGVRWSPSRPTAPSEEKNASESAGSGALNRWQLPAKHGREDCSRVVRLRDWK